MIRNQKINPLNFFQIRKLEVPPKHFEYISIPLKYNLEDSLSRWIEENLKGRYYIGKDLTVDNNNLITVIKVGFEDHKELSYFNLACPHLKYM